jgi:hypothetical protein
MCALPSTALTMSFAILILIYRFIFGGFLLYALVLRSKQVIVRSSRAFEGKTRPNTGTLDTKGLLEAPAGHVQDTMTRSGGK